MYVNGSTMGTGLDIKNNSVKNCNFLAYVLGTQKNHFIEMVLLSTHNISFDFEIRKLFFCYAH